MNFDTGVMDSGPAPSGASRNDDVLRTHPMSLNCHMTHNYAQPVLARAFVISRLSSDSSNAFEFILARVTHMQANITRRRPFMPRRPHPDFEQLSRLYEQKLSFESSDDDAGIDVPEHATALSPRA
jgi:hypothetical protein